MTGSQRPSGDSDQCAGHDALGARLTRRQLLVRASAAGLSVSAIAPLLAACGADSPPAGQATASPAGPAPTDPTASPALTTRRRTVVPDPLPACSEKVAPYEIAKFKPNGYGAWHYGPGLDVEQRLDLMPASYDAGKRERSGRPLRFFTISDIHISDIQSPAQAVVFGFVLKLSSGYSPVMLYTCHVLDAAMQTVNAIHRDLPLDFGLSLGDTCNNTQYNELRWYMDVIDGKSVRPDSGVRDDGTNAPSYDYLAEFQAGGLDKSIPWYQAIGNHDHFWIGSLPVDPRIRKAYVGTEILQMSNPFASQKGGSNPSFYCGSIEASTRYGEIIGTGPIAEFPTPPRVQFADPRRRSLRRDEWIQEFFDSTTSPQGHGFTASMVETGFACFTFEPKSQLPVKVIVLDDTQSADDPSDNGYGHSSLDKQRYDWLKGELEKGQAQGKLMVIAAHVPIGVEPASSGMGWSTSAYVTEKQLLATLHSYPNLLVWLAGHRHRNTVTAMKSPDPERPELGFWEVETSSLRDFPQQFRTFEIVRNTDDTVSIVATCVDPAVKDGTPAAISRSYGVAAQELFDNKIGHLPTGSYDAELVIALSPEMRARV
jgi:metallophosphoesterase (TIGR03768 family)